MQRPMSLNGYSWVEGQVINLTDPTGISPISPPVPMPFDQFVNYIGTGGAVAAASLCVGPQAAACAAIAGTALLAAGGATALYYALVNADWDAYRAYEASIAAANEGRYPPPAIGTPSAPVTPPPRSPSPDPDDLRKLIRQIGDIILTIDGARRFLDLLTCPQPQPNSTPEQQAEAISTNPPVTWRIRHYTSCINLTSLNATGFYFTRTTGFIGGPYDLGGGNQGIFFTDILPFRQVFGKLYHPLMIAAALGIPEPDCYLDVDRLRLGEFPWYDRPSPTGSGKVEHIYVTGRGGASVGGAILDEGTVESLG